MSKKIQSAGGIGESKMFNAPDAEPDPILACHINGVLISELGLEPHILAVLNRQLTDEGIAEKNARPEVRESSGVTLGRDGWDKSLEQRRDDVKDRDMDLYQARDPFKEAAAFAAPGMRPKMLSARKIKEGGLGDHQVVKYPAGHPLAGDPVMVKGMVLGEMPERRAIARNKHYRDKSTELLKQVESKHQLQGGAVVANQD
jgi:hypothetical protein